MTSQELKQWRKTNGYSQVKLADALTVHIMTVSRWERGAREIPPFLKLALRYLELKGDKVKQKPEIKLKTKQQKTNAKKDIYGECIQTWSRLLDSILPKW